MNANFVLFWAVYLAALLGMLFLTGFGLYRMAQHAGLPNPWLAFLPFANLYITGLLAERSYYTYNGRTKKLAKWILLLALGPLAGAWLYFLVAGLILKTGVDGPVVWLLVLLFVLPILAALVLQFYCQYYIFRDYSPDNAMLFTIVGVLFNISFVFLLIERNTVPVSVTGFGFYPYGRPKYDRWHRWNQVPPQQAGPENWPPPGGPNTTGPGDYYRG